MLRAPLPQLAAARTEGLLVERYHSGTAGMPAALRGADARRDGVKRKLGEPPHNPSDAYRTVADAERAAGVDRALSHGALTGSSLVWEQRLVTDENGQLVDTMQPDPRAHNLTQRAVDDFFIDNYFDCRATYDALGTVTQKTMALIQISEKISAHPQLLGAFASMIADFLDELDAYNTSDQTTLDSLESFLSDIGRNITGRFDTIEFCAGDYNGEKCYVATDYDENEMAVAIVSRWFGVPLPFRSDGHGYRVMHRSRSGMDFVDEPQEFTFKSLRSSGRIEVRGPHHFPRLDRIFTRNGVSFSVLRDGRAMEIPQSTTALSAFSPATGRKCFMHKAADGVYYPITYDNKGLPCELAKHETHIIEGNTVYEIYTDGSFRLARSGFLAANNELIEYKNGCITQRITKPNAQLTILIWDQSGSATEHTEFSANAYFDNQTGKIVAYKDSNSGRWRSTQCGANIKMYFSQLIFTDGRQTPTDGYYRHDEPSGTWTFVKYD